MVKKNIVLIGFMGTGKTTICRLLAERLQRRFVDIDDLIEKRAGKPIAQIFKEEREARFRELEVKVIRDAAKMEGGIISCGGGAVINRINAERLKKNAVVVLLVASPETILERALNGKRPLLNGDNRVERIELLLEERDRFYREVADYQIDTTGLDENATVEKILAWVREERDESHN